METKFGDSRRRRRRKVKMNSTNASVDRRSQINLYRRSQLFADDL